MKKVSVSLPPVVVTHTIPILGKITTELKDISCSDFDISSIASDYSAPLPSTRKVSLRINDLSVGNCKGKWVGHGLFDSGGSFTFRINDTSTKTVFVFDAAAKNPIAAPVDECKVNVNVLDIRFTGSFQRILDLLASAVRHSVERSVDKLACSLPEEILETLSPIIIPFLKPEKRNVVSPTVIPAHQERLVDWSKDVELLQAIPGPEKLAGDLNSLIDKATEGHPGELAASNFSVIALNTSFPGNLTGNLGVRALLEIQAVSVSGLNTLTDLALLRPGGSDARYSLASGFAMESLSMELHSTFELKPENLHVGLQGPPLVTEWGLKVSLQQLNAQTQAVVAASYDAMDEITLDGLQGEGILALDTVAAAILALNVTEIETFGDIAHITLVTSGDTNEDPLANGIAATLNNFGKAFVAASNFSNILPNIVDGHVLPDLRRWGNSLISEVLYNLSSTAPPGGGATVPAPTPGISSQQILGTSGIVYGSLAAILISYFICFPAWTKIEICPRRTEGIVERQHSTDKAKDLALPLIASNDFSSAPSHADVSCSLASEYTGNRFIVMIIPVLLLSNMAIGLWSLFVPVCDVRVRIKGGIVDPEKIMLDDSLLVYSFTQMVHDFWFSGSYLISILLVMGSALLPQAKGLATLYLWLMPMKRRNRGWAIMLLDIMGRMAFVDQCFICLMIATLRTRMVAPGFELDIVAEPIHGIASGTFGVIIMMVSSCWGRMLHNDAMYRSAAEKRLDSLSMQVTEGGYSAGGYMEEGEESSGSSRAQWWTGRAPRTELTKTISLGRLRSCGFSLQPLLAAPSSSAYSISPSSLQLGVLAASLKGRSTHGRPASSICPFSTCHKSCTKTQT